MPTNLTIQAIIRDVLGSTGHRYALHDSVGNTMDTLKIIANPAGGYLGVYHRGDEVQLATSADLLTWTFRVTLDGQATQPTMCTLPTGGFLTAVEFNNQVGSGGQLRLRHYPNISALLTGSFNREKTITRTLSACNEGTPSMISVSLTPDIDHSVIDVAFHFQRDCDVDRQARGVLTNFSTWSAAADPGADNGLIAAAAVQGRIVNGNIGDRDTAVFDNIRYSLHEMQYTKGDFGSWRCVPAQLADGQLRLPIRRDTRREHRIRQPGDHHPDVTVGQTGSRLFGVHTVRGRSTWRGWAARLFPGVRRPAAQQFRTVRNLFRQSGFHRLQHGADRCPYRLRFRQRRTVADHRRRPVLGAVDRPGPGGPDAVYTFHTQSDDGVRLWIDGVQLVNDWTDHGIVERSGTIALTAGRKYDLRMEYYDNSAGAFVRLLWSGPGTPKAIVPADHLFQPATGLTGEYFAGITLDGTPHIRTDATVNFNWGNGFGDPNVGAELFSVRWTGRLTPQFSETYRIYAVGDDGVRLWVNNIQLVNNWTDHGPTENSGTITLTAGVTYDLRMEYYERAGGALVQLLWSSPSVPKQVIPRERLTPRPSTPTPPVV